MDGWNIATNEYPDASGEAGRYCSVGVNGNGMVCVAYLNTVGFSVWDADLQIRSRGYTTGSGWSGSGFVARVIQTGVEGLFTSVAFDASDTPHISYYDQSNGDLLYNLGSSANASIVDSDGDVGEFTSIAVDSHNWPRIVYYDRTNGRLKYASFDGSSWTTSDLVTVGAVSETGTPNLHRLASIAIDNSDRAHVCYYDPASQSLKYMKWTGTAWTTPETVDAGGGSSYLGVDNSMKLDRQGRPRIASYDATNADLRYAAWNGSAWDVQTLESTGDVGRFASLTLDGAGNPHIAFSDYTNRQVKYKYWDGSAWQSSVIETDEFDQIKYVSSTLDKYGTAFVSYYLDWPNNNGKYLRVAAREGLGAVPNPDLVATVDLSAGQTWVPGQNVTVPVTLTNNGIDPAQGAVTVNLFRSNDNVFDDPQSSGNPDPQVGSLTANVNLAQGESRQFMISFVVPAAAQPGPIYPIAQVVASSAINEIATSNNVAAAANPAEVVWQAGPNGGHANSTIMVQDSSGVATKFAISGGGYVEILGAGDFTTLNVHDTTASSVLTITTPGTTTTSVGDIVITGSLKILNAKNVELRGSLTITGTVGTIVLGNVMDDHLIDLNSSNSTVDPKLGLSITLAKVSGCSLDTHGIPIKSLQAISWSGAGTITAPYMTSLTIKGDAAHSLPGDFGADLVLTSQNAKGVSLGSVSVAGRMSDDIQAAGTVGAIKTSAWTVGSLHAPSIGALSVTGRKASATIPMIEGDCGIELTLNGTSPALLAIKTLSVAGALTSEIAATGSISSIKASSWTDGALQALSVGAIAITGRKASLTVPAIAGDCAVDFTLNSSSAAATSIKSLTVAGSASFDIGAAGAIGAIKAGSWTSGYLTASSFKSLQVIADIQSLDIYVPGGSIGSISARRWTAGSVLSSTLKSLTLTGQKANPAKGLVAVPGDMAAFLSVGFLTTANIAGNLSGEWSAVAINKLAVSGDVAGLTLDLNNTAGTDPTTVDILLGNLSVAGWIRNSTIIAYGNLGAMDGRRHDLRGRPGRRSADAVERLQRRDSRIDQERRGQGRQGHERTVCPQLHQYQRGRP
jgi:hypothetical protein